MPLADPAVSAELTRNLEDAWRPILDTDIDGTASVAFGIDTDFKNLGRFGAARRVARTVFIGSAPRANSPNRGVDARRVRLGCSLPGEPVAIYGDAQNRLTDRATYFYVEGGRAWFGTQPGVAKLARDRSQRYREQARDEVVAEIVRRLRSSDDDQGDFAGIHVAPSSSADVADTAGVRLVVLAPDQSHVARSSSSAALDAARDMLEGRGNSARNYRNCLIFLAADDKRREDLEHGVADYLAWSSIDHEAAELNLDVNQAAQARTRRDDTDRAVDLRLADTYVWAIVPAQPDATGPIDLTSVRADGQGSLARRVSRKLVGEGSLYTAFPPVLLRLQLDERLSTLWETGHVTVGALWETFARYVYLPRLRDEEVLLATVRAAPNSTTWTDETFATADVIEDRSGRYLGLVGGGMPSHVTPATLLVRPDVAVPQLVPANVGTTDTALTPNLDEGTRAQPVLKRRFVGTVQLDAERLNRDFGRIVQDVLAHLAELGDTQLAVTVEVVANRAEGFPENVVNIVVENARSLRFVEHEFE